MDKNVLPNKFSRTNRNRKNRWSADIGEIRRENLRETDFMKKYGEEILEEEKLFLGKILVKNPENLHVKNREKSVGWNIG